MNITHIKNYDVINELPSDEIPVSENEIKIVNMLFKENVKKSECKMKDVIDVLFVGGLFALLSLPFVDTSLRSMIIFQDEIRAVYIILLIKILMIMFLFWIIKYYGKKVFV